MGGGVSTQNHFPSRRCQRQFTQKAAEEEIKK